MNPMSLHARLPGQAVLAATLAVCTAALAGCPKSDSPGRPSDPGNPHGSGSSGKTSLLPGLPSTLPALPAAAPVPAVPRGLPARPSNAPTVTPNDLALGELLFFDARLSKGGATACATCHQPTHDWSGKDRQANADGAQNLRRAPSLSNLAWQDRYGWDARHTDLRAHLTSHLKGQLGHDAQAVAEAAAARPIYQAHFVRASTGRADAEGVITALAAFVTTRYAGNGAWDRAEESAALDPAAIELRAGYQLFTGKAQCAVCHVPPLYFDGQVHRLGILTAGDGGSPDLQGGYRTPGLRGAVARTSFFHDGTGASLEAAIDHHLSGGTSRGADRSIVDPALPTVPLESGERQALIAFVRALAQSPSAQAPVLPP